MATHMDQLFSFIVLYIYIKRAFNNLDYTILHCIKKMINALKDVKNKFGNKIYVVLH